MKFSSRFFRFSVVLSFVLGILFVMSSGVSALQDGDDFQPGRIIDDAVFWNPNAMSVSEIQTFLEDMLDGGNEPDGNPGSCDTNGTEMVGSQTRAQYSINSYNSGGNGIHPPFICLPEYYENPNTGENNYWEYNSSQDRYENVTGSNPSGSKSAAQLIYDVAQAYGINPQVLIVLLQKEQSLVTDDWPWGRQYEIATGYGCPDSAPCQSDYYGLFNQLDNAAWQFNRYRDFPGSYSHVAGQINSISYHPNGSCGAGNVYIYNQATAGLYNYTPYQPNTPALNNLYGTGNSCSSYGNRNFWRLFSDWFGSTFAGVEVTKYIAFTPGTLHENATINAEFRIKNLGDSAENVGNLKVVARGPNGENFDFPTDYNVVIQPGATYTYNESRTFTVTGDYEFRVGRYDDGQWHYPPFGDLNEPDTTRKYATVKVNPTITTGIDLDNTNVHHLEDVTATFSVTNHSNAPASIGRVKVAARNNAGQNWDFASSPDLTLSPGQTYNYSATRSFPSGGVSMWITNYRSGIGWSNTFPSSESSAIQRSLFRTVKSTPTVTSSLKLDNTNIHDGQDFTATFNLKNYSDENIYVGRTKVAVRDQNGNGFDFPSTPDLTLTPGEVYNYSQTRSLPEGGYNFWIANHRTGIGWSDQYPSPENGNVSKTLYRSVKDNPTVTTSLKLDDYTPTPGQDVTATFNVKNYGDSNVYLGRVKVAVRDSNGNVFDFGSSPDITLTPGEVYSYSKTRSFSGNGTYNAWIANFRTGIGWSDTFPDPENGNVDKTKNLTVSP